MNKKKEWKKLLMRAVKIAVGSSAAIYIAQHLGLDNAVQPFPGKSQWWALRCPTVPFQ